MPIYNVTTPEGERVVEAKGQKDAIDHCVQGDYTAESLSSVQLAEKIRAGASLEQTEAAKKAEEERKLLHKGQSDIEDKNPTPQGPKDPEPEKSETEEKPKTAPKKKAA